MRVLIRAIYFSPGNEHRRSSQRIQFHVYAHPKSCKLRLACDRNRDRDSQPLVFVFVT